jgi:hypothetical protein
MKRLYARIVIVGLRKFYPTLLAFPGMRAELALRLAAVPAPVAAAVATAAVRSWGKRRIMATLTEYIIYWRLV